MREQLTALQQQARVPQASNVPSQVQGTPTLSVNTPSSLTGRGSALNTNPQGVFGNQNHPFADFERLQNEMLEHRQQLMATGMSDSLFGSNSFGIGSSLNT